MYSRARTLSALFPRGIRVIPAESTPPEGAASPLLLAVIADAGLLVGIGSAAAWATCPCGKLPADGEVARLITGLSFVAVGVASMAQGRRRRIGRLMAAVGFTWFIYDLGWVYVPITYTVGTLGAGLYQPILAHLTVVFPSGRLRSGVDRTVVVGTYILYGLASLGRHAFWDPRDSGCPCPANLLLLHRDAHLYAIADQVTSGLLIVVTGVVMAVLVWHWRRAGQPGRRALTPVLASSLPIAALVVATTIVGENFLPPLAALALTALPLGFLAGLLRLRLERAAVGALVVELEGSARVGRIREALARTLHDPTLEVAYWLPSESGYVDADGQPVTLSTERADRSVTLLERAGQPVAALIHDAAVDNNPELVEEAAAVARLAIENERLQAEIKAQLQQVRASRARIVTTGDAERRRIERNLHDGAQQRLVTLALMLGLARDQAAASAEVGLERTIDDATEQLRMALAELRELARGIHPAVLSEAGLHAAIESLADRLPLVVVMAPGRVPRLDGAVEAAAYFVVAEALTNVVRYARASIVHVSAMYSGDELTVEVVDDGVGGADSRAGSGLVGLRDRVGALGGRLAVVSASGHGTRVTAVIPATADVSSDGPVVDGEHVAGSFEP